MRERHVRQVLAELELCSMSSAAPLAPSGGGKPGSVIPTLGEKPPADYWRQRLARGCDVEEVRAGAEAELNAIRRGPGSR